ncbi:MAG: HIT domain-containing protein [Acidobacteriota bacterium]|nr:HIT domain-containing protein [Acidobacteriota bacterium]
MAAGSDDAANYVVYRGEFNFALLNLYPYTSGHLMVVPYEHAATLESASEQTATEMFLLVRKAERYLRDVYRPEGVNIGMNIGSCAGAGVAGHIHMHVLPRWVGDANFMSTVGETRVLPEELGETCRRLRAAFAAGARG